LSWSRDVERGTFGLAALSGVGTGRLKRTANKWLGWMELRRLIIRRLSLSVGVVANTTWTISIRIDRMMWRRGPTVSSTRSKAGRLSNLEAETLDRPDELEESLVVVSVEASIEGSVGDFDLGTGQFQGFAVSSGKFMVRYTYGLG
jgi:hypothetical protein